GEPVTLLGVIQDITEQKQFADELSKQVRERTLELNRSNEDLLHFAHIASHDLKEPVRKIKVFSNMLEEQFGELLPEKGQVYLGKVQNATNRMFSMIEGILTYSAINASDQTIENVDLNEVIDNIKTDLEVLIQFKNATINSDALPVIEGASVLIYQLFYNLVNNALKFSKADVPTVITIRSVIINRDEIDYAEISVADNGIGIEQEYTNQIFNAFTRLNAKDKYEGTGLGLALCKKIVDRHHGMISATGIQNEGAVFTILLPLEQLNKIV
ncbi:MAG TPA: ATP-binding protein, partial [Flavobacterium sp.]|nr:ATP-binding protein [Flavobacterium sp.]